MSQQDSGSQARRPSFDAESGDEPYSARDLVRFAFRHRRLMLGVISGVTALASLLVYLIPPVYRATSLILVEPGRSPTLRADTVSYPINAEMLVASEIEIVLSRAVAESVVDRLALDQRPVTDTAGRRLSERIKTALHDWGLLTKIGHREGLIRGIQVDLKAKQPARTNLLEITYPADSPEHALEMASEVTEAYLEYHQKIFTDNTSAFLAERVRAAERELNQSRMDRRRETSPPRIEALELREQALEASYLFYMEKLDRAGARDHADASLSNVRIVDYPTLPAKPRFSRLLLIFVALVGSSVLSISVALVADFFDSGVYRPEDLASRIDVPVLGSVRRARRGIRRRILGFST